MLKGTSFVSFLILSYKTSEACQKIVTKNLPKDVSFSQKIILVVQWILHNLSFKHHPLSWMMSLVLWKRIRIYFYNHKYVWIINFSECYFFIVSLSSFGFQIHKQRVPKCILRQTRVTSNFYCCFRVLQSENSHDICHGSNYTINIFLISVISYLSLKNIAEF